MLNELPSPDRNHRHSADNHNSPEPVHGYHIVQVEIVAQERDTSCVDEGGTEETYDHD